MKKKVVTNTRSAAIGVTFFCVLLVLLASSCASDNEQYLFADTKPPVSLDDVEVTEGDTAYLPCDMSLPSSDDAIYLVLWFLEPQRKPLYTFDARGKPLSLGRRWSEVASFGQRADFRFTLHGYVPTLGQLSIANITLQDEGIYRCRVDFKNSPARHFRVKLNVIVPPSTPEITDERGHPVNSPLMEPLLEDRFIVLRCRVTGGRPPPELSWFLNDQKIPSTTVASFSPQLVQPASRPEESRPLTMWMLSRRKRQSANSADVRIEEIKLGPLQRYHQDARLSCQASNSQMNSPKRSSFVLDMQLPPLKVDIQLKETRFVAGEHADVRCQAVGSRPSAQISWWKDNERLPDSSHKVLELENVTVSILKISPRIADHGKILICRAENTRLTASAMEASIRLDVQFPPLATLRLGPTLNADIIKEGDDVYFECSIQANPDVVRLVWKQEERALVHNTSSGIIMSNQSLVLRGVTRRHSGNYKCIGVNSRGEGVSNQVPLTVRYAPLCQQPSTQIRGAERREFLSLKCSTDSLPPPVKFRWAINTTRGWKDVASSANELIVSGETSGGTSGGTTRSVPATGEILRFRPELEGDFGTVACWAVNDVGWQNEPCLFRISPAGPPDSLSNCTLLNQTADSIHVACQPNSDGGLKQSFQLQALDVSTGMPLITLTSTTPEFWLSHLEPGSTFMLYMYAVNVKGLSPPLIIPVSTLKEAAKRTVPPSTDYFTGNVVGAVAMGTGAGALLTCAITVVACFRCKRRPVPSVAGSGPAKTNEPDREMNDYATIKNGYRGRTSTESTFKQNNRQQSAVRPGLGAITDDDDDDVESGFSHSQTPIRTCAIGNGIVTEPITYLNAYSTSNYLTSHSDVPESCV